LHLKKDDPHLLLFVKFISYSILRPIEICRLKIEDVDVQDKKLYVKAKNKPVQIKIIPEILLKDLPDLSNKDPKTFLFGRFEVGQEWDAEETNKRNEFSKRFKKIKDHFKLGEEYGLYSFKHTFITKLYNSFRENMSQHEAKSNLMPITGHSTMIALEKYLRDIDAELPEDYSEFLK
jgi:integrase